MFRHQPTSTLGQRARSALDLARSFLLLEDDYDVDWEVDEDEREQVAHPHRAPLRARRGARRPGVPEPAAHVCLSPVGAGRSPQNDRRKEGSSIGV